LTQRYGYMKTEEKGKDRPNGISPRLHDDGSTLGLTQRNRLRETQIKM